MKRLLLPILLLIFGSGAGVAAGLFLTPPPAEEHADLTAPCGDVDMAVAEAEVEPPAEELAEAEYVPLDHQFIVPVVEGGARAAMMLVTLSLEVPAGQGGAVGAVKPLLQAAFLQVLFDHANAGGFSGIFTEAEPMSRLRADLDRAGNRAAPGLVRAVLITEITRQEG